MIVEDCSTSWSSDDDDHTTRPLDKIDDNTTSVANDDATPCTLDGDDDGSCSDDIATTSSPTSPHCFMSQGDTKVSNANVVDHVDSYDELVSRLASMTMSLENEKAKTLKLENKNSFLKNTCGQQKHLLYVISCSHVFFRKEFSFFNLLVLAISFSKAKFMLVSLLTSSSYEST